MIPKAIQRNDQWIKQLFELLTILFNLVEEEVKSCPECGSINLQKIIVTSDREWLKNNVRSYNTNNKDPTSQSRNRIIKKRA
jgi:hypothetical protein